jgi:hypothetical protein
MSLAELLPKIQELSQSDRQELVRLLQRDLPEHKGQDALIPGQEYPVWSPNNGSNAANILMNLLETRQQDELDAAYKLMAEDKERESAALAWAEALIGDSEP